MSELVPAWPPNRLPVDDDRAQSFRRAVDRGGQPRRSGTHHDHVEDAFLGAVPSAEGDRRLLVRRIGQHLTVEADQHREGTRGAVRPAAAPPVLRRESAGWKTKARPLRCSRSRTSCDRGAQRSPTTVTTVGPRVLLAAASRGAAR